MRILVVDHDARGREVLVQRMRGRGFSIDSAGTAAEAIDLMTMSRYDFVLLEVVMPHDAFAAITGWLGQATAAPRIIITSGIADLWRRANPSVKIAGILTKPYTMEEVLLVIGAAQRITPATFEAPSARKTLDC